MPYYIKPRLTFTTNPENVVTDPGPNSWSMALNTLPTADIVSGANKGRLAVGNTKNELITTSATQERIIDGFVAGGATKTPGTVGCYVYLKNHSVTAGENILVGIVSNSRIHVAVADDQTTISGTNNPLAPHVDTEDAPLAALEDGDGTAFDNTSASTGDSRLTVTNGQTLRTFTLLPGEFAFFPFDYTGDVYIQAASGAPKLEFWEFAK